VSYSGLDHTTNFQGASDNVFEPTFEDKKSFMEDYYFNVDEKYVKEHEDFFANSKQNKSKNFEQGNFGGSKSQLLDWSNLIQTQLLQEKSTMGASDNKNKLQKAYRTLITLDERNWYEEMVALYKVYTNFVDKGY